MKLDFTKTYQTTGNPALDGCASCIMWHRKYRIGLRAIHLSPRYYEIFRIGTEIILDRSLEPDELLSMDGVLIEKGSIFQIKTILPETFNDYNRNQGIKTDGIKAI